MEIKKKFVKSNISNKQILNEHVIYVQKNILLSDYMKSNSDTLYNNHYSILTYASYREFF